MASPARGPEGVAGVGRGEEGGGSDQLGAQWSCPLEYRKAWRVLLAGIRGRPQINLASNVIAALRTLETGQFFSASPAIRANAASSRFGTWARSVRAERLMRNPWPSGSRVTAASVLSSVGV